jgi:hypothetical protein
MTKAATMSSTTTAPTIHGHNRRFRGAPGTGVADSSADTLVADMSITLLLGLGIVIAAAIALVPMIFTPRSEPATTGASQERGTSAVTESAVSTTTIRVPERVSVHPAWWERLRGVAGLLLFTLGAGMATAVAVGLVVLFVGLAIQH